MSRHRADRLPRFVGDSHRPRHCSGVTPSGSNCVGHDHADDRRCKCGQVLLPTAVPFVNTLVHTPYVDSSKFSPLPMRHSAQRCHVVTPAAEALMKAGA